MIPRIEPEGMLFGKLGSTFPDHALASPRKADPGRRIGMERMP
jgi:hypothetical protein